MDLTEPPRKPRAESIVPMINVVFLLLIFFLMTSRLARPDPFDVAPPSAMLDGEPSAEMTLYVDKTGRMSFDGQEGEAALRQVAALATENSTVQLRADAALEAAVAAELLRNLAAAGLSRAELAVAPK